MNWMVEENSAAFASLITDATNDLTSRLHLLESFARGILEPLDERVVALFDADL